MFKVFWDKEKNFITFSGVIAALGALFLNIPSPQLEDAKIALANIQVFWLVLLTLSLAKLFFSFTTLTLKAEREMKKKYDLPMGAFSMTVVITFLIVIGNFWRYIFDLYGKSFSSFIDIIFPALVAMGCAALLLFVEKRRNKFTRFSYIIILSFVSATTISAAGIYLQQGMIGYFYFYWLNLVLPGLFLVFALGLMISSKIKKKRLLEALPPEISVHN